MSSTESTSVSQQVQALEVYYGCDQSPKQAFSAWMPVGFLLRAITLMYCGKHNTHRGESTPDADRPGESTDRFLSKSTVYSSLL